MCLLRARIRKDGDDNNSEEIRDIIIIKLENGILKMYDVSFREVIKIDIRDVKNLEISTLDAYILLDIRSRHAQSPQ